MSYQADRFTAFVDACVLASALKRNVLLSFAEAEIFRCRWSEKVMDETERTIAKLLKRKGDRDAKSNARLQRTRMGDAFEEASVDGFEELEPALTRINQKDRHVLAAAIKTGASVIVTDNLRDFPADYCSRFDVEPKSADAFLADCISLSPSVTIAALREMRERFRNPEITAERLITLCEGDAMFETASLIHGFRANI